jgi:ribose transport system ATP-binding protein
MAYVAQECIPAQPPMPTETGSLENTTPLWEMRDIVKRYRGVAASDHVSLKLLPGQIHGLLGENGCGKSTLIKILAGVEQPTEGLILREGRLIRLHSPTDARRAGIATVFQEFSLVPDLSVAENIFLGRLITTPNGLVDWKRIHADSARTLADLGLADEIDSHADVRSLSVAQQQLVEIAKAVSINARTLVLDEPTAALSVAEVERLHTLLRRLKAGGHAILYVSHRLDEVVSLIDVATVLKDGRRVRAPGEIEIEMEAIVAAMIGRAPAEHFPRGAHVSDTVLFEAKELSSFGIAEVSFALHAGEILGIAGAMGSGRTSLLRTLFGLQSVTTGSMRLRQEPYAPASPSEAITRDVAYIPENRRSDSLFLNFQGAENVTIASLARLTRHGLLDLPQEQTSFRTLCGELSITPHAARTGIGNLSGGNQQKIVLARWIFRAADLFLLDEPTQGIDVNAKVALYQLLRNLTKHGKAIALVSSDLDELLALSDRIVVLRSGVITEIRSTDEFDKPSLAAAVAGITAAGTPQHLHRPSALPRTLAI